VKKHGRLKDRVKKGPRGKQLDALVPALTLPRMRKGGMESKDDESKKDTKEGTFIIRRKSASRQDVGSEHAKRMTNEEIQKKKQKSKTGKHRVQAEGEDIAWKPFRN